MSTSVKWMVAIAMLTGLVSGTGLTQRSIASTPERPAAGNTDYPIPGIVEPYCNDTGQISLNRCAANWLSVTTALYHTIKADVFLGSPEAQQIQFALAEDAWVEFKDAHCSLVAEEVEGGSLYPMVLNRCLARLTNERIAAVQAWGIVPEDPSATETQLQDAYLAMAAPDSGEGPLLELAQLHWETYRTYHCQFERDGHASPEAEADCLARLAAERTAQLEELIGRRG